MTKSNGNPKFVIRVAPLRRKTWERAAKLVQRTLSDFIKVTVDEKTEKILADILTKNTTGYTHELDRLYEVTNNGTRGLKGELERINELERKLGLR